MNQTPIKPAHDHRRRNDPAAEPARSTPSPYHAPRITVLGSLDRVQAYYTGTYWDGPNSWLYYN